MSRTSSPLGERFATLLVSVIDRIRDFVESLGALVSPRPALVPVPSTRRERPRRR